MIIQQDSVIHIPPLQRRKWRSTLFFVCIVFALNSGLLYQMPLYMHAGEFYRDLFLTNVVLFLGIFLIYLFIINPIKNIFHHIHQLRATFNHEHPSPGNQPLSIGHLGRELSRFTTLAIEYYRKQQELSRQLSEAQKILAQFTLHQDTLLDSTSREIGTQYRAVLAYANYLEDQIMRNKLDPSLRYDFDDVCESSFNLKLIAGALAMLSIETPPHVTRVLLADITQRTMLALAPALDRRAMKLTTAEVDLDVAAHGDPGYISHILWMMLLGMIRHAADESTLRIRCFYNHDTSRAMMSIVVSQLATSALDTTGWREETPQRFAQTIGVHGNIQLAHLLTERMGGSIEMVPLTISSCEICMALPAEPFV